jgi:hypothetical protein
VKVTPGVAVGLAGGVSEEMNVDRLQHATSVIHVNLRSKTSWVMTDVHTSACVRLAGGGWVAKHFTSDAERLKLI